MKRASTAARVIQLVARLPPAIDGVGDYAVTLAAHLSERFGVSSDFVVCSGSAAELQRGSNRIRVLAAPSSQALCDAVDSLLAGVASPAVLLHYVGYGYERNGAPRWLLDGVQALIGARPEIRLATIFHELYATSPPWRRAFWYSRRQKYIVRKLLALSSASLCTVDVNRRILTSWRYASDVECLAVPSALGEPPVDTWPPFERRRNAVIVFGLPASRQRTYASVADWDELIQSLRIDELIDAGPEMCRLPKLPQMRITRLGSLAPSAASCLMLSVKYGLLAYPLPFLAKSSVFAAYASHGVAALVPGAGKATADGLVGGCHLMDVRDAIAADDASLVALPLAAREWYSKHAANRHAEWAARFALLSSAPR